MRLRFWIEWGELLFVRPDPVRLELIEPVMKGPQMILSEPQFELDTWGYQSRPPQYGPIQES